MKNISCAQPNRSQSDSSARQAGADIARRRLLNSPKILVIVCIRIEFTIFCGQCGVDFRTLGNPAAPMCHVGNHFHARNGHHNGIINSRSRLLI